MKRQNYKQLLENVEQSGVAWQPGMNLRNSNGAIDASTLGYEYTIQTTTLIRAHVMEQKFYEIPFADYIPTVVGEGAYMENVKTNVVYHSAGDFERGIQSTAETARIMNVQSGIAPINAKINTWVGGYEYSDLEVEKALASDNWDVIRANQSVLKKVWDLGLQKISFLGSQVDQTNTPGLLSNAQVTVDVSTITKNISSMSPTEFGTFVSGVLAAYFSNAQSTVLPDHFAVPYSDWLGLVTPINPSFPNVSMLTYLLEAFRAATGNPNFTIYPVAYADQAHNVGYWAVAGTYRYCLYRMDPDTVRFDIPIDFVLRAPMSPNNFNWNGVALGQFTGTIVYRAPEFLYFDHT